MAAKKTDIIRSGEVFAARTLETRFALSKYEQFQQQPNVITGFDRSELRRGRAPIPPKNYHAKRKHKSKLVKKKSIVLRHRKRQKYKLLRNKIESGKWIENHIWHSKRFLMSKLWNMQLAMKNLQNCKKSYRNTMYHLKKNCTLHDASYNGLISIKSNKIVNILSLLNDFVAPFEENDISLRNENFIKGKNELKLHLYWKENYPFGYLCDINCMFDFNKNDENNGNNGNNRILWIWCHVSSFNALWDLLSHQIETKFGQNNNDNVTMTNESSKFLRYELRGPMSSMVLFGATKCFIPNISNISDISHGLDLNNLILSCGMYCNPTKYSCSKCYVIDKKSNNFSLKSDLMNNESPMMNALFAIHKYHLNNEKYCKYFHHCLTNTRNDLCKDDTPIAIKRHLKKDFEFEIAFMLIWKKHGWDIIVPKSMSVDFKISQLTKGMKNELIKKYPRMKNKNKITLWYDNIGRFVWQWLHFAGGKAIGWKQKIEMFHEMNDKKCNKISIDDLIFPYHCLDSFISVHYWLKYIKFENLIQFFKKPKGKRHVASYPPLPFDFSCNFIQLFGKYESLPQIELTSLMKQHNSIGNQDMLKMTLNIKNIDDIKDCLTIKIDEYLMNKFDPLWNDGKAKHNYFLIRDKTVIHQIDCKLNNKENTLSDTWSHGLVMITIAITHKGVVKVNDAIYLNENEHIGYVVNGGYSTQQGKSIGMAIVCVEPLLIAANRNLSVASYPQEPNRRSQCTFVLVT